MTTPEQRQLEFAGSAGRPVRATLHGTGSGPLVVVAHGFKGFRNWGFFPTLCDRFAEAGFQALRFDFSHNGVEETDFDRLDLFLLDTWTRHQEDLRAVLDRMNVEQVGLVGHSRGGGDVLLYAPTDPRVQAVATLAAVAAASRFPSDTEKTFRRLGYYPIENTRTKQIMPIARCLFEDSEKYDILDSVQKLGDRPLLVVHGKQDESVPFAEAEQIAAAHGNAESLYLDGSGHTFECVHPFAGESPALKKVAEALIDFFRRSML